MHLRDTFLHSGRQRANRLAMTHDTSLKTVLHYIYISIYVKRTDKLKSGEHQSSY